MNSITIIIDNSIIISEFINYALPTIWGSSDIFFNRRIFVSCKK
jgi:hypothetical protein